MGLVAFSGPAGKASPKRVRAAFLRSASMEVMPRTAAKVSSFRTLLPKGTRVFVAHIAGTPIEDMVACAARLRREGMEPVPHLPARIIASDAVLQDWLARYRAEAGISQALVLAGGLPQPLGVFETSMQILETGHLDRAGIRQVYVAGHPEGSRDIDPGGGEAQVMAAARWKAQFAARSDAQMAMVTQFAFEAAPILAWLDRLRAAQIDLPVHVGLAGPAKLQTLIKFAVACGVGPSLRVLQRRAKDVTKLLTAFEPTDVFTGLSDHKAAHAASALAGIHLFPLGGIAASAAWLTAQGGGLAQTGTGEFGA